MSYKITVRPSGHNFEAEPSETLLQAGLRAGLNLGHSCATGSCGDCRARLLAGEISLAAAISSLDWVSSHDQFGRNDPTAA